MNTLALHTVPGRTTEINGKEYLFFSGYAYLGMGHVTAFNQLVKEGINKYGILFPSSRISNTRLKLYEECEALLSAITQCEETVLMPSGFLAGRLAVAPWHKKVYNRHPSHPSITGGGQINNDYKIIAVDSVDPLTATITDFSFINNVDKKSICIIDDSHGFGLIGENGCGVCNQLPKQSNVEFVIAYSLSKACNITAGAVSCTKNTAEKLRGLPAYTASTSVSPAFVYAFIHAQELYRQQREKLLQNISCFQSLVKELPVIKFHKQLPVFILPNQVDEDFLFKKNIIISSFAYPHPEGEKIQRIVLNALHTQEDLEYIANVLKQCF